MKNLLILTIIVGIAQTAAAGLTLCINSNSLENTDNATQQAEDISLEPNGNLEHDKATGLGGIFVQNTENPAITPAQGLKTDIELDSDDQVTVDILLLNSTHGPKDFLAIDLTTEQAATVLLDPNELLHPTTDSLEN